LSVGRRHRLAVADPAGLWPLVGQVHRRWQAALELVGLADTVTRERGAFTGVVVDGATVPTTHPNAELLQDVVARPQRRERIDDETVVHDYGRREYVLHSRVTVACMAETLTIRLDSDDRAVLEAAARARGKGLSAYVRELAEAEARHVRRAAIRADGERVLAHLAQHPEAQSELEEFGTPLTDLP
jgi:uncharacterized protein (DUF1778 family)